MRKPAFIFLVAVSLAAMAAAAERPNIILILTDDLGYGDLSCYGQKKFTTPALDRFAAEGARLTHHYSAAPVCAPSRASLLLGVHQGHANVRDNQFDKALENNHTLATVLRRAGYTTAAIGKWGLHGQPVQSKGAQPDAPAHPLNRGFDSFYGLLRHIDGHEHYPKEAPYFTEKAKTRGPVSVWENRTDVTAGLDKCYTTDLFTARAKKFIIDHHASSTRAPFFLFLAHDTPHAVLELPTQAYPAGGGLRGGMQWIGEPGRMINTASGVIDSWIHPEIAAAASSGPGDLAAGNEPWSDSHRRHATSVRRIDDSVADLLRLLVDLGIDDHTLIVFTSDNGPEAESMLSAPFTPEFLVSFGPFDGLKRDLWEGGIRVPTLARWPGRIPAGSVVSEPCAQWEWLPTFAEAAGLPAPARCDGTSLLGVLSGAVRARKPHRLYFEYFMTSRTPSYPAFQASRRGRTRNQMQSVRLGDHVGVRYDVKSANDNFEIYNVVTDPKETTNLARDPAFTSLQEKLKATALRARRPDATSQRPYDEALVSALSPADIRAGLEWRAFAGPFPWVPDFASITPSATGTSARPDPESTKMRDARGFLFAGLLVVPADGEYTFHLTADTGAVLRLHEATLIDADFGHAGGTEKSARISLQAGAHPFLLSSLRADGDNSALKLEWSGPNLTRQLIADGAFAHIPSR